MIQVIRTVHGLAKVATSARPHAVRWAERPGMEWCEADMQRALRESLESSGPRLGQPLSAQTMRDMGIYFESQPPGARGKRGREGRDDGRKGWEGKRREGKGGEERRECFPVIVRLPEFVCRNHQGACKNPQLARKG